MFNRAVSGIAGRPVCHFGTTKFNVEINALHPTTSEKTSRHTRDAAARPGVTVERFGELVDHVATVNPLASTWGGPMASGALGGGSDTLKSVCHMATVNPLA
jgi:hypothetical protein